MDERSKSAAALDAWCDETRGRASMVSRALDVAATTVNYWRRGVMRPTEEKRKSLESLTSGAVKIDGWGE